MARLSSIEVIGTQTGDRVVLIQYGGVCMSSKYFGRPVAQQDWMPHGWVRIIARFGFVHLHRIRSGCLCDTM